MWRGTIVWIEAVEESVEVEVSVVSSMGSSGKEERGGSRDSRARRKEDGCCSINRIQKAWVCSSVKTIIK